MTTQFRKWGFPEKITEWIGSLGNKAITGFRSLVDFIIDISLQ
ncbi:MAG: hypothetical protein ACXAEL_15855 [Candidatus Hodarchaeales archaeon]|jgi:hypothetical protein